MRVFRAVVVPALVATLALATAAAAQTTEEAPTQLTITTPYPGVAVEPGNSAGLDLQVRAPSAERVQVAVSGVPEGWSTSVTGGGFLVDTVTAGPSSPALRLDVDVPSDAAEGDYQLTVTATGASGSAELPLTIRVTAAAGGTVELTSEFPGLRGPTGTDFQFNLTLANDTPADIEMELSAEGPAGWQVEATPATETQASTVTVEAGADQRVNVTVTPAFDAEAGQYPVTVSASGSGHDAETQLIVEITGSFEMQLSTSSGRLNADVTVGQPSDLALVVQNSGSGPLEGVTVSATPPSGWDVTLDPETIASIPPNQFAQVTATITPSSEAVAGDYVITFSASNDQARDTAEVRATVSPSPVWGFVGIGLIVLAIAGLGLVFRRFGRR